MDELVVNEKPSWARQLLNRRGLYYKGLVDSDDIETLLEHT